MILIQIIAIGGSIIVFVALSYIIPAVVSAAYFDSKLDYQKKYMDFLASGSEQQKEVG